MAPSVVGFTSASHATGTVRDQGVLLTSVDDTVAFHSSGGSCEPRYR